MVHSAARDVLVSLNLGLIHRPVAKAIFFGSKQETFQQSPEEAEEYAMEMCAKFRTRMFRNGGVGFAIEAIDHNLTIAGNLSQFAAIFGILVP